MITKKQVINILSNPTAEMLIRYYEMYETTDDQKITTIDELLEIIFTSKEIDNMKSENKLKEIEFQIDFSMNNYLSDWSFGKNLKKPVFDLPEMNLKIYLEYEFGGMELGTNYYKVLRSEHNGDTQYWLIPGWYQSYEGSQLEIENTYEVKKAYKQVIDWQEKAE